MCVKQRKKKGAGTEGLTQQSVKKRSFKVVLSKLSIPSGV